MAAASGDGEVEIHVVEVAESPSSSDESSPLLAVDDADNKPPRMTIFSVSYPRREPLKIVSWIWSGSRHSGLLCMASSSVIYYIMDVLLGIFPADRYADHSLSGGTVDRPVRGCFHPVTVRNREEKATMEKEEKRERGRRRGRTSTRPSPTLPSLDDPYLVCDGYAAARLLLCRVRLLRPSTSSSNAVDEEKP
ncbi:hypothetical protein GW17_00015714 [Ensete ventricosum]|nr:hypothetical protein GW17_00015714 [Ensete ventricosum]